MSCSFVCRAAAGCKTLQLFFFIQSSLWLEHKAEQQQLAEQAAVLCRHIIHTGGTWFLRGHLSDSVSVHPVRMISLGPAVDIQAEPGFCARKWQGKQCTLRQQTHYYLSLHLLPPLPAALPPPAGWLCECIYQLLRHSPTSHLPAGPDWVRGDALPHVAPSSQQRQELLSSYPQVSARSRGRRRGRWRHSRRHQWVVVEVETSVDKTLEMAESVSFL